MTAWLLGLLWDRSWRARRAMRDLVRRDYAPWSMTLRRPDAIVHVPEDAVVVRRPVSEERWAEGPWGVALPAGNAWDRARDGES